jgi:hypothetical protein
VSALQGIGYREFVRVRQSERGDAVELMQRETALRETAGRFAREPGSNRRDDIDGRKATRPSSGG